MEVSGQLHAPPLTPKGRAPGTHWIGHQRRSGRGVEEKNSDSHRESSPRTPIVQPVAQKMTYTQYLFMRNINFYRVMN